MKGTYLSEFTEEIAEQLADDHLNLIVTPCGSGKTTFAVDWLKKIADINLETTLYLIDSAIGKQQILRRGKEVYNPYTDTFYWVIDGVTVMTYAGYATLHKKAPERDIWDKETTIICDEFHNCVKWAKWTKWDNDDERNIHDLAMGLIAHRIYFGDNTVVALSATPHAIREEFDYCLNEIIIEDEIRHYEDETVTHYFNLTQVLNKIKSGEKGIIYLPHITEIKKCQEILLDRGIRVESFWSINNTDHPMTAHQLALREFIINHSTIPRNVDVLLINKSCETSVNIESHIDFMIIHSSDSDTQTQARGRYRNDLRQLYLYADWALYEEKIEIPKDKMNVRLFKDDITRLIEQLDIRDETRHLIKKPTFIEWLRTDGYSVDEKKIKGGQRYIVINQE